MKKKWIIIALLPLPIAIIYFAYKYISNKGKNKDKQNDDKVDEDKKAEPTTTEGKLSKLNSCPRDADGYPTGCGDLLLSLTEEATKAGKKIIILDGKYVIE